MPLYSYKCPCGLEFDRFLPLSRYSDPQTCNCGEVAVKLVTAPAIQADYPGYQCPVSGKWIEGRRAHQENLARTGCRVLEPGEAEQASRRRAAQESEFEASIERSAEAFVEQLPTSEREQLGRELEAGAGATVVRT